MTFSQRPVNNESWRGILAAPEGVASGPTEPCAGDMTATMFLNLTCNDGYTSRTQRSGNTRYTASADFVFTIQ